VEDPTQARVLAFLATLSVLFLITFFGGAWLGTHVQRCEALKAGVARWTVDPATGSTSFRYGPPAQKASEAR
jgi:hypothetical protein